MFKRSLADIYENHSIWLSSEVIGASPQSIPIFQPEGPFWPAQTYLPLPPVYKTGLASYRVNPRLTSALFRIPTDFVEFFVGLLYGL